MKTKTSFLRFIQLWAIIIIIIIGGSMVALDMVVSHQDFNSRAAQMRSDYIADQKQLIKQEVTQVVDLIRAKITQTEELAKKNIKSRVHEAYAIAQHIYLENKTAKSEHEIQKMIIDALRPIRFEQGSGYYFVTRLDGTEVLIADKPELEGSNLLDMQDTQGRYVVKDMIEIAKQSGEGFYQYHWTKPAAEGNDFKKIAFIKRFEPYDWFIGTGLYVDDVESQIKADLLVDISRFRYGKEGYIFVNRLNGDALVSNGKRFSGTKKLWEIFNQYPEKIKDIFKKEYNAASKPDGDYIYYSWIKLTDPTRESPKASFVYGIHELQWLVGAGVYLDDVETVIAQMQTELNNQIKARMLYYTMIIAGIVVFFLFLFSGLNRRLKKDFNLFISFFNRAALSDEPIDRDQVQFNELDQMAENANKMLEGRRQAEEALRKSEAQYRFLTDNISDVLWTMDMAQRFIYISPSVQKLRGYTPEEAILVPLEKTLTPVSYEKAVSVMMEEFAAEGKPGVSPDRSQVLELEHIRKDGSTVWGELTTSFIRDEDGLPSGIIGVTRDITERRKAEVELRTSRDYLEKLTNSMWDIVFSVKMPERVIEWVNDSIRLFGYEPSECIGKDTAFFYPDKEAFLDMGNKLTEAVAAGKDVLHTDQLLKRKNGETFSAEITVTFHKENNEVLSVTSIIRDITERNRLEEQLRQAQKMESIGRLAGGVAHDYNNALAVITGFTEMAMDDVDPEGPLHANLDEVLNASKRAADITRQLLAFARKQTIAPTVLDLNDSVEGMFKMLRRLIGEDIDLTWSPGAGLWSVKMDPSQIDQILVNLCINARDAIDGVGKVSIETKNATLDEVYCANHPGFVPGEFVQLAVSDNGCGMDKETRDNIFEPFFTTKDVGEGTGLGMATIYGILKQNTGFVNVYSEPGKGATIKAYLPRHEGKIVRSLGKSTAEIPQGRGETILVVEDDLPVLKLAEKILTGLGYTVLIAGTTEMGLVLAREYASEIALLVTDVIMPEMNGRDLAQQLQALYPDLKYMFMSGYTADILARRGVLDEGVHFIQKPFSRRDLAVTVRNALGENN